MARPVSLLAMGATGATGAYIMNNRDTVGDLLLDNSRSILHGLTAPRPTGTGGSDTRQLEEMVLGLGSQVDQLARSQRQSHQIIVASGQPTTFLGIPIWQLAGVAGVGGYVLFKIKGYNLRDLVYVSKRHFNAVADGLKKQYENLETTVNTVKQDLMQRIGLVESRVDDAKKSIHDKIDVEVGKLGTRLDDTSERVSRMDVTLTRTSKHIETVAADVNHVKVALKVVGDGIDQRLDKMHSEVEDMKETTAASHNEMRTEMGKIDGKIDGLTRSTQSTLNTMHVNIENQSKGINLLCEYVCQAHRNSSDDPVDEEESRKWLQELEQFTQTQKRAAMASPRSVVPLAKRRQSGGLANFKSITAS